VPHIDKQTLQKNWLHSTEEDTDTEMVLRPADYDFPLTRRPRESYQLRPDGTLITGKGAFDDSLQEQKGTWKLEHDNLTLYTSPQFSQKLKILSVDNDRLVLRKQ
jgi:hypothetical protein